MHESGLSRTEEGRDGAVMTGRRPSRGRVHLVRVLAMAASALLMVACGDDDSATGGTTTSAATSSPDTAASLEQPAIWPSADVVFASPEAVAEDFVLKVFGVPPTLGQFRQADARSGEIEVLSAGEGGGSRVLRSLLVLRQLGPDDGWFIVAAINENVSIASLTAGQRLPAGPVTVAGRARGFEAHVVVSCLLPGRAQAPVDQEVTQGGALAEPQPYTVVLDLADAAGERVAWLLVRGGTGLEMDTGEFSAIPVLIAGS